MAMIMTTWKNKLTKPTTPQSLTLLYCQLTFRVLLVLGEVRAGEGGMGRIFCSLRHQLHFSSKPREGRFIA